MKQSRLVPMLAVSAALAVGWPAATEEAVHTTPTEVAAAIGSQPQQADRPAKSATRSSIPWYSIDGSAGSSKGGGLKVQGTVGQPDAGIHAAAGLDLEGGFWAGQSLDGLFADGFETGDTSRWSATVSTAR